MARTVNQIKQTIIDNMASTSELAGMTTSFSKVSLWNLFAYAVAYCAWTIEVLFDLHKSEIDTKLLEQKPHGLNWYRTKALSFQYGHSLVDETDYYNNTGISDDDIEASKIVKYAAVNESDTESRLIIKIAGEDGGVLAPILGPELTSIETYFEKIKDAGVKITIKNSLPDKLYLNLDIYYNPLVLDSQGNNILQGGRPVETALNEFMKELPFDGILILANLIDRLQKVDGVVIPHLNSAYTSWLEPSGYTSPTAIIVKKRPESGYFEIEDFTSINYIPNV